MFNVPYREMPGSVTLKSHVPMEYSRAVLTNIWSVGNYIDQYDEMFDFLGIKNAKLNQKTMI